MTGASTERGGRVYGVSSEYRRSSYGVSSGQRRDKVGRTSGQPLFSLVKAKCSLWSKFIQPASKNRFFKGKVPGRQGKYQE